MSMRDLIPSWPGHRRGRVPTRTSEFDEQGVSPFLSLHREINRLFDDAFRSFEGFPVGARQAWPSVEVKDNDKEMVVTAELPGMEEKDVELNLRDGVLTIRGERSEETKDEERAYSELYYGRFERRIPLGQGIDEDNCKASFQNGVLTVTLPKTEEAESNAKRIPIGSA